MDENTWVVLACVLVGVAFVSFWLRADAHVIEDQRRGQRVLWLVLLCLTGILGAVLYEMTRRPRVRRL